MHTACNGVEELLCNIRIRPSTKMRRRPLAALAATYTYLVYWSGRCRVAAKKPGDPYWFTAADAVDSGRLALCTSDYCLASHLFVSEKQRMINNRKNVTAPSTGGQNRACCIRVSWWYVITAARTAVCAFARSLDVDMYLPIYYGGGKNIC